MNELTATSQTMTSREIAELTGKRHDHVMRDLQNLSDQGVIDLPKFGEIAKDAMNRDQTIYRLPKRETLILTSGYSATQRAVIIDRWLELEGQIAALTPAERLLHHAQIMVAHERQIAALEHQQAETKAQVKALVDGEDYWTIVGYSNQIGDPVDTARSRKLGKAATQICRVNGWKIGSANHPVYGPIHSYPRQAVALAFDQEAA
jgi:phage regulator Rha-like protein